MLNEFHCQKHTMPSAPVVARNRVEPNADGENCTQTNSSQLMPTAEVKGNTSYKWPKYRDNADMNFVWIYCEINQKYQITLIHSAGM